MSAPFEGMAVYVTRRGARTHGLVPGAPGVVTRVASPDARHGRPTAIAHVLVSVGDREISTAWPTADLDD